MLFDQMKEKRGEEVSTTLDEVNRPERPPFGRDELNLAEFPLTVLTDKVPEGLKTLVFEDQIRDKRTGELVNRKLTISGSDIHGLPTPLDMDVLLCLIHLTKERNDFESRRVLFSRGELLSLLGLPDSGKHYKRLDESLRRWVGVTLYYDQSWWDKETSEWTTTEGFHILENITIVDGAKIRKRRAKGQLELLQSSFTWNEVFLKSCNNGYIKALDLNAYLELDRAIAKRLYRFLDKHFYRQAKLEFDLNDFCFTHIGMSRNFNPGQLKSKLGPALEELEKVGFLKAASREERYFKAAKNQWRITLEKGTSSVALSESKPKESKSSIFQELVTRQVTPSTAKDLAEAFPLAELQERIEVFDWLIEKKDKRVSRSPAGFLVESIREGYARPVGFISKAQRAQEAKAKQDALQRKLEGERLKRDHETREEEERKARDAAVKAHLAGLSAEEEQKLRLEFRVVQGHGQGKIHFEDILFNLYVSKKLGLMEQSEFHA